MIKISSIDSKEELNQAVKENTNVLRAIRLKCLDCSCFQLGEVRDCPVTTCPLYPFRLGENPYRRKRELSEDEKREIKERLHRNNTTDKN